MEKAITQLPQHLSEKPITNGKLAERSNFSGVLGSRDGVIITLIQTTQRRRGLPLITVDEELDLELTVWGRALKDVPDEYLERAYDRAAEGHDWNNYRHPFTADLIPACYRLLRKDENERREAERVNAAKRNPDTYACFHCSDLGYQVVFVRGRDRWYSSVRPCCCELAPIGQRNTFALEGPVWVRNRLGEYAKADELKQYGAPNEAFESVIKAGEGSNAIR